MVQIKQARGFRRFLLRGLEKLQRGWAMICLSHNLLKLHRLCYGSTKTTVPRMVGINFELGKECAVYPSQCRTREI